MMAACGDLRSFLARLESMGRLSRVAAPVDKDKELACVARWAIEGCAADERYAIRFDHVIGFRPPVVVNLYDDLALYADAIGADPARVLERWAEALDRPHAAQVVADGPAQEVAMCGESATLRDIPIPTWTPGRDAGPYIPSACVITKDPVTGVQNVATYRIQVHGERRLGVFFGSRFQHGAMHYAKWSQRGEPMPIALAVGVAPAIAFAAGAKTAYGVDELTIAGGLIGRPIEVVRGRTVDLLLPADAEYLIEGVMPLNAAQEEGPFGEALGYMNDAAPAPYLDITAVTHRREPIFHGYVQQLPPSDGHLVMELGVLGPLWWYLTRKLRLAGLRDLAIVRGAAGVAALVAQVEAGAGSKAGMIGRTLAKLNFGQKFIYLVDEDVDIRDLETLSWAISCRVDPARDISMVNDVTTWQLDPSVHARAAADGVALQGAPYKSSLAVVDATIKSQTPALSLPRREEMDAVARRWHDFGLPPLKRRRRLERLLGQESRRGA